MRFSIFEYSQEKLLSAGLDVIDALLLNWFANFYSGKMEKRVFKDDEGKNKVYGWIKISKVQEDLPVIGISTEKGIRRRFDNFVEKGILERKTINSQLGKRSFYKTTDLYEALINTEAKKLTNEEKEYKPPKENNNNHIEKEPDIRDYENPQGNSSSYAEKNGDKNELENPQRTKMTYADKELDKAPDKSSQRNSSSYAEGNSNTFAERNSSSYALNDSLIRDSKFKDTSSSSHSITNQSDTTKKTAVEADFYIHNKIKELFGGNVFDHKLYTKLHELNTTQEQVIEYITWLYDYSVKKNPDSLIGYFYNLANQPYMFNRFIAEKAKPVQTTQQSATTSPVNKLCPVCGDEYPNNAEICPHCDFDFAFGDNKKEILLHRMIYYQLDKKTREQFLREKQEITVGRITFGDYSSVQRKIDELLNKYGIHYVVA